MHQVPRLLVDINQSLTAPQSSVYAMEKSVSTEIQESTEKCIISVHFVLHDVGEINYLVTISQA